MPVVPEVTGSQDVQHDGFRRFAWAVLAYNVLVVLWGAYVRASGSGAGCGSHWPLCNGEVVPLAPKIETVIEFVHRVTSGLAVMSAAGLWLWSFRVFPRAHRGRKTAALAIVFLMMEALLGAGLVLFRYVAKDASAGRALYLSAHLINTQLLLGMLAATAWLAGQRGAISRSVNARRAVLLVTLVAGITGAIAALGDTLYPASSMAAGMAREFSNAAPLLLRLRLLHPVVALAVAVFLVMTALKAVGRTSRAVLMLVFVQVAAGILNWILLAPIWMQIVHLLIADLLWIALVLFYLEAPDNP